MTNYLTDITNFILQYNTYFDRGYSNGYAAINGIHDGEQVVFPNDTLGDYFYLRPNQPMSITVSERDRVSDCSVPMALSASVIIVASVKNADPVLLVNNLANTLSRFGCPVNSVTIQPEEVVQQELGRMGQDDIAATLARLQRSNTLVSLTFTARQLLPVIKLDCLPNPCSACG